MVKKILYSLRCHRPSFTGGGSCLPSISSPSIMPWPEPLICAIGLLERSQGGSWGGFWLLTVIIRHIRRFLPIYNKIWKMIETLHYFTTRGWTFESENAVKLWNCMAEEDRKVTLSSQFAVTYTGSSPIFSYTTLMCERWTGKSICSTI
jgi:hypothetical protein